MLRAPSLRGDRRITRYVVMARQPGQGWGMESVLLPACTHHRTLSKLNTFSPGKRDIKSMMLSASLYTVASGTVSSAGSAAFTLAFSANDVNSIFTQFSPSLYDEFLNFRSAVREFVLILPTDEQTLDRNSHSNKHSLKLQT